MRLDDSQEGSAIIDMTNDMAKAQQKIVAVLARMLVVAPESITPEARYQELFNKDPDSVHAFAVQVERVLGVIVGDSVLDAHPTVAELAVYCVAHKANANGGRRYVVVCRMPDGNVRERIYIARGHEKAVQQAMDDGAEAVVSVEREDAEDAPLRKAGHLGKVLLPILIGIILAAMSFLFFWWRNGCPRLW